MPKADFSDNYKFGIYTEEKEIRKCPAEENANYGRLQLISVRRSFGKIDTRTNNQ